LNIFATLDISEQWDMKLLSC